MIGFVLAVVAFSKTHKNIYQQIASWPQPVFAVFALIAVGTLVPILRYTSSALQVNYFHKSVTVFYIIFHLGCCVISVQENQCFW